MNKNILLILASGKSSRLGGFPKAFCKLNQNVVAQNTINCACNMYDKIYMAVSKEIYPEYKNKVNGCNMFDIITGRGDAHSLLRALYHIASCEQKIDKITVCWGDAVFTDDYIFRKTIEFGDVMDENTVGIAVCAIDEHPYAWFDVIGNDICCSYFAKEEGDILKGIHDQSIFIFKFDLIIRYLEKYKESMHISDNEKWMPDNSREMKLMDSFTFFYKNGMLPMQYCLIDSGKVFSFNTEKELNEIKGLINQ